MALKSVAAPPERLFADDYSSTGQAAWAHGLRGPCPGHELAPGEKAPLWRNLYLGQLRFDSLVCRTLIFPDSHLLDGSFFVETDPAQLRRELGRPERGKGEEGLELPIEFRLRTKPLAETLKSFLVVEGQEELNGFTFKTISDATARVALARQLTTKTRSDLARKLRDGDPAAGIAGLLRECLRERELLDVAGADIDALERSWGRWIREEDVVAARCATYRTNEGYVPAQVLDDEPIERRADGLTSEAASALEEIVALFQKDARRRSEYTAVLDRFRRQATEPQTLKDLDEIDAWVSRARYRAIARQHDARFVQLWDDGRPFGRLRRLFDRVTAAKSEEGHRVELPEHILDGLADLPDEDFRGFLTQSRLRKLRAWWEHGDIRAFAKVAHDLGNVLVARRGHGQGVRMVLPPLAGAAGGASAVLLEAPPATAPVAAGAVAAATASALAVAPARLMQRRIVDAVRGTVG